MASRNGLFRQLTRVRSKFVEELDINTLLPRLLVKRLFTLAEILLDILSTKDRPVFIEFCRSLEELAPHLLTTLVLESLEQGDNEEKSTAAVSELSKKDKASPSLENVNTHRNVLTIKNLEESQTNNNKTFNSIESLPGK
ncbi:unnamed protein product, partial [Candidula unifasciata]